ncbi:ankyrin repeat domain-containing protein [Microlunatus soli]|uniref:Uncharacterized protein n=1 Tax=Microlunatus soli TaxID=630515 RepID=A0A1H1RRM4_9ACTN|nr:ankyrin repeat domain-containing protein [Microlunatus soli]SDS38304.1 hypothetical protein SAMN04489812_1742 [Microlunatus soli]
MGRTAHPDVEVIDLEPGLWIWRQQHPSWKEGHDWPEVVTSVCVDVGDQRWVLDPLLPPDDASAVWDRLSDRPPTAVAVLIPDHLRESWGDRSRWSSDLLADRYGCRVFGPNDVDPDMIAAIGPLTADVETIVPGTELPGGLVPFRDVRGWAETPLWIPEHHTLVFGDGMTERDGSLRVWMSPTHEERALPDLQAMLALPFQRVIISHGRPVHDRRAFEDALERPPWPASSLHIAAWRGDFDRVRTLVQRGADLAALSDTSGETPLQWAMNGPAADDATEQSRQHVINYLRSAMAEQGYDH